MVFFVFLHMMRVFYHGAYKPPREFNWVVGVVLLFLTIMLSFTGYLLPWDQIAYWAITIGTNMGGYAPLFNTPAQAAPARRPRGRPEHAAALLRAPRHVPAARRGDLPRRPLLADPQGRRHQSGRCELTMTDTKHADRKARVVLPVDPTRRTEIDKQRVPMSARPYRLLALVKQDAVVRVQKEPDDTVMTWPHLLTDRVPRGRRHEHLPAADGPVHQRAARGAGQRQRDAGRGQGAVVLPRLQELLAYFHPTVAGVLVPTFVLVGAALIPYVDRGNILAIRPSQRKTAVMLFTLFCILGLIVTFVGIFFRGPGYTFVIPYVTSPGLHFAL